MTGSDQGEAAQGTDWTGPQSLAEVAGVKGSFLWLRAKWEVGVESTVGTTLPEAGSQ